MTTRAEHVENTAQLETHIAELRSKGDPRSMLAAKRHQATVDDMKYRLQLGDLTANNC